MVVCFVDFGEIVDHHCFKCCSPDIRCYNRSNNMVSSNGEGVVHSIP